MVQEGDVVYCLVNREDEATLKVGGTVVEAKGDTVVIASPKHSVQGVPNIVYSPVLLVRKPS